MAPTKPRNTTFKDAVVAQMSLKAHFAIADNHPTDKSTPELAKLMFRYIQYFVKRSVLVGQHCRQRLQLWIL
jgi:hypothetical protein